MTNETIPVDRTILDARGEPERFRMLARDWLARTVPENWREYFDALQNVPEIESVDPDQQPGGL